MGYFMGLDRKEAPYLSIPLNNVIELTPHAYGCHEKRYCLMMKEEMLVDGQDEPITSMTMVTVVVVALSFDNYLRIIMRVIGIVPNVRSGVPTYKKLMPSIPRMIPL